MNPLLHLPFILANCPFDKTPTLPILFFEAFIVGGVIAAFLVLPKLKDRIWLRFLTMSFGVLLFELFTAPMWHNWRMGEWAYIYQDVSWILTIGWSALILSTVLIVDQVLPNWKAWKRFIVYLAVLLGLVSVLEVIVVNLGIRGYADELLTFVSGIFILGVPIDLLYYVPVFTALVISFYKYWSFEIDRVPLVPLKHPKWWRSLLITFLGVFLFEVMIVPIVSNEKLPQWSYIFHDISVLMIGIWIGLIWLATNLVNRFFIQYNSSLKFGLTVLLTGALAWPIESWFILNGYRVYGPSAVHNFSGFMTPITGVPIEIAFAIPCYVALIITFIRYWENILDNRL